MERAKELVTQISNLYEAINKLDLDSRSHSKWEWIHENWKFYRANFYLLVGMLSIDPIEISSTPHSEPHEQDTEDSRQIESEQESTIEKVPIVGNESEPLEGGNTGGMVIALEEHEEEQDLPALSHRKRKRPSQNQKRTRLSKRTIKKKTEELGLILHIKVGAVLESGVREVFEDMNSNCANGSCRINPDLLARVTRKIVEEVIQSVESTFIIGDSVENDEVIDDEGSSTVE